MEITSSSSYFGITWVRNIRPGISLVRNHYHNPELAASWDVFATFGTIALRMKIQNDSGEETRVCYIHAAIREMAKILQTGRFEGFDAHLHLRVDGSSELLLRPVDEHSLWEDAI